MWLRLKSYDRRNNIFLRRLINSRGFGEFPRSTKFQKQITRLCCDYSIPNPIEVQFSRAKKETPQGNLFLFSYFVLSISFWHSRIPASLIPIRWINCSGVVPLWSAFMSELLGNWITELPQKILAENLLICKNICTPRMLFLWSWSYFWNLVPFLR